MQPNQRRLLIRAVAGVGYLAFLCYVARVVSESFREALAFTVVMLVLSGMVWLTHRLSRPPPSIMKDVDAPRRRKRDRS